MSGRTRQFSREDELLLMWPLFSGRRRIPIFARDQGFYYGELPREPMRQILAEAEREGWSSAVTRYCDQVGSEFVLQYVTSPRRLGVKYLFPNREHATALDCGCGWGMFTTDLARRFEFVYAMDLTWERAKFTQIRAAQENLTNVAVLCAGDTPHLPFPPNSLDFVLLLGVLEWIPESFPESLARYNWHFCAKFAEFFARTGAPS